MKVSSDQIEIPEECPEDCKFKGSYFGMCMRCPVSVCTNPTDNPLLPVCEPENYRADWAREWELFFKKLIPVPQLYI